MKFNFKSKLKSKFKSKSNFKSKRELPNDGRGHMALAEHCYKNGISWTKNPSPTSNLNPNTNSNKRKIENTSTPIFGSGKKLCYSVS